MTDSFEDEKAPKKKEGRPRWWRGGDSELVRDRIDEVRSSMGLTKVVIDDEDRMVLLEEARKRNPHLRNMLDVVFERNKEVLEDGQFLTIPIYASKGGERVARALKLRTRRRLRLDDYGWAVWRLIDGRRTLEQIGCELGEQFGEKVEPLYPRLGRFMTYLINLGVVKESE